MALRGLTAIAAIVTLAVSGIGVQAGSGALRSRSALPHRPPVYSANWCGYQINGGPFTAVSGTFGVPRLAASPRARAASEWVGISGTGVDSLIQAGVTETYDPSTRRSRLSPWWEALPYLAKPVTLTVGAGDRITVTIERVRRGAWGIWMTDDTTGKSFRVGIQYAAMGTSADWIVERPASAASGRLSPLASFTPAITFADTRVTGHQTSVTEDILAVDGDVVATPSKLTPTGFGVSRRTNSAQ